jgi:hypothetical protein
MEFIHKNLNNKHSTYKKAKIVFFDTLEPLVWKRVKLQSLKSIPTFILCKESLF